MDLPHHPASAAKKWFLIASSEIEKSGRSQWCALCWPVVVARCALQGPCAKIQHDRAQQQHAETANRLARCGRRLRPPCDAEERKVQEHLQQQLHPLQIELAKRLDQALHQGVISHGNGDVHSGEGEVTEVAQESKRARHEVCETKTELRSIVSACLPELIAVLHTPPSQVWMEAPPPLDSTNHVTFEV